MLFPGKAHLTNSPSTESTPQENILHNQELPVTILEFRGKLVFGQHVRLNWAVRDEIDVDYYEVQKIVQGIWTPLDRIPATGQDEYNYKDFNIAPRNVYRLKVVDLDESFEYSDLVRIKSRRFNAPLTVFPNPFTESFKIINENQDYSFQLFDSMGNILMEGGSDQSELEQSSSQLEKGVYFLQVIDKKTQIRKTIKIKKTDR